jgi:hypothetical protein
MNFTTQELRVILGALCEWANGTGAYEPYNQAAAFAGITEEARSLVYGGEDNYVDEKDPAVQLLDGVLSRLSDHFKPASETFGYID